MAGQDNHADVLETIRSDPYQSGLDLVMCAACDVHVAGRPHPSALTVDFESQHTKASLRLFAQGILEGLLSQEAGTLAVSSTAHAPVAPNNASVLSSVSSGHHGEPPAGDFPVLEDDDSVVEVVEITKVAAAAVP